MAQDLEQIDLSNRKFLLRHTGGHRESGTDGDRGIESLDGIREYSEDITLSKSHF